MVNVPPAENPIVPTCPDYYKEGFLCILTNILNCPRPSYCMELQPSHFSWSGAFILLILPISSVIGFSVKACYSVFQDECRNTSFIQPFWLHQLPHYPSTKFMKSSSGATTMAVPFAFLGFGKIGCIRWINNIIDGSTTPISIG